MTGGDASVDVAAAALVLVLGEAALRALLADLADHLVEGGETTGGGQGTE
jgi:hypothetical protein